MIWPKTLYHNFEYKKQSKVKCSKAENKVLSINIDFTKKKRSKFVKPQSLRLTKLGTTKIVIINK